MGSQQPFPLSKLLFMSVKTLAGPLSRWDNCCVSDLFFLRTFISCGNKILFYQCHTKFMNICRKFLHRAKTDTLFRLSQNRLDFDFPFFVRRKLIVLPPAHLYHFYEAKIKFRVMNLGKVLFIFRFLLKSI